MGDAVEMPAECSAAEFYRLPEARAFELVAGRVRPRGSTCLPALVSGELLGEIGRAGRRTGWVLGWGSGYQCFPDRDTVRRANIAYIRRERLTPEAIRVAGHCQVCPDLVVEVVSPTDGCEDVAAKRTEWLAAGAQLVWVVLPIQREVYAYTAAGCRFFGPADTLVGEPVLADFRVPVVDLFPTTL
jgi:Uma2 family endonuclease